MPPSPSPKAALALIDRAARLLEVTISFARRSSRFSFSSALRRAPSSVESPGRFASSISAAQTQFRNVYVVIPSFEAEERPFNLGWFDQLTIDFEEIIDAGPVGVDAVTHRLEKVTAPPEA